ncbi:MAG: OAM dimerization domain-containing protein [Nitrospinota bacterium]
MKKDSREGQHVIRPYGDTVGDGFIQLAFTLPVENGAKARKAAQLYASKLNLFEVSVVHSQKLSENFTYFVVYGKASVDLDYDSVVASEVKTGVTGFYEINRLIKEEVKRVLSVVGATIGSDAHTVGIDAIINMKGYNQDYGLERYPQLNAINMGAQVSSESLVKKAVECKADAILVSQTVTQKDSHIRNFTELVELLEAEGIRDRFLLIAGGARVNHELAIELGYDAGFGPETLPSQVAAFIVENFLLKRRERGNEAEIADE